MRQGGIVSRYNYLAVHLTKFIFLVGKRIAEKAIGRH
ncbi:protein of unknown function [Paraburkholderia kururiensis]